MSKFPYVAIAFLSLGVVTLTLLSWIYPFTSKDTLASIATAIAAGGCWPLAKLLARARHGENDE